MDKAEAAVGCEDDDTQTTEKLRERNELNIGALVHYIKTRPCKKIIVIVGRDISTFEYPGTETGGDTDLTASMEDDSSYCDLPDKDYLFDIELFKKDPKPFFKFFKHMFARELVPSACHYFLKMLHEKGLLLRLYTQNIDTLERVVGIPPRKIIEVHGTFYTSHCMNRICRKEYDMKWVKEQISEDGVPTCTDCGQIVKPDIHFYGDSVPKHLSIAVQEDFSQGDLLIIMGASLNVEPIASIVCGRPQTLPTFVVVNLKYDEVIECRPDFYRDVSSDENLLEDIQKLIDEKGLDENTIGKLLIGDAHASWTNEVLQSFFEQHGDLKICQKVGDYILVVFSSADEVKAAMAAWNNSNFLGTKMLAECPGVSHGEKDPVFSVAVESQVEHDLTTPQALVPESESVPGDKSKTKRIKDPASVVEVGTQTEFGLDFPCSSGTLEPSEKNIEQKKESESGSMVLCGLPRSISVEELGAFFEKFGVLEKCEEVEEGHVELKMASEDEKLSAIEAWNKSEVMGYYIIQKDEMDTEQEEYKLPVMQCDMIWLGTCEDGCYALATALGWKEELESMAAGKMEYDLSSTPGVTEDSNTAEGV